MKAKGDDGECACVFMHSVSVIYAYSDAACVPGIDLALCQFKVGDCAGGWGSRGTHYRRGAVAQVFGANAGRLKPRPRRGGLVQEPTALGTLRTRRGYRPVLLLIRKTEASACGIVTAGPHAILNSCPCGGSRGLAFAAAAHQISTQCGYVVALRIGGG